MNTYHKWILLLLYFLYAGFFSCYSSMLSHPFYNAYDPFLLICTIDCLFRAHDFNISELT